MNRHPDQYRKLRENPALIPSAVSEIIRWQSPIVHMRRTALEDGEIGGKPIRAGDKDMAQVRKELKGIAGKARTQITKDYIAWPVISGAVMTLVETGVIALRARKMMQGSSR